MGDFGNALTLAKGEPLEVVEIIAHLSRVAPL